MLGLINTFGYIYYLVLHTRIMTSNNTIAIPSVCLPRIYHKFDANYIEGILCELFGPDMYGNSCVDKIDMVSRTDRNTGEPFHLVFIHFSDNMYYSEYLSDFATRIDKDEEIKIQYSPPWFWKVRKNKAAARKEVRSRPRIMNHKDEAEILKAQSEILQQRNDASNGNTLVHTRRAWKKYLTQEEEEETDKDNDWPPPLEWGEDADVAEVR